MVEIGLVNIIRCNNNDFLFKDNVYIIPYIFVLIDVLVLNQTDDIVVEVANQFGLFSNILLNRYIKL